MRNLQEGRHSLAGKIFHGKKGDLYQRYRDGMEDQLGALGLVLNCIVLWNTVYINAALEQLRAAGHPVLDEDVVRLSPIHAPPPRRARRLLVPTPRARRQPPRAARPDRSAGRGRGRRLSPAPTLTSADCRFVGDSSRAHKPAAPSRPYQQ